MNNRKLNNQYRYGEVENYEDCTKNIMKVKCKGHKPSYTNRYAAGLDLRSNNYKTIYPDNYKNRLLNWLYNKFEIGKERPNIVDISSRLAVEIPKDYFGMLAARSGLSYKHQIKLINDIGIIDEDYRGDIGIRLINEGKKSYSIEAGDRVAQMIILPYIQVELEYVEELKETERNDNGFGSSGR